VTRRGRRWWLVVLAIWTLVPIATLVLRALARGWRYPQILPAAGDALPALSAATTGRLIEALATTVALAVAIGPVSAVIGFTIGRAISRATPLVRRVALALSLFLVIAPPTALGVGLQVATLAIGVGGTLAGVFLAHLVPATGYSTLFAVGVYTTYDFVLEEEARTLGARPRQVLSRITLPMLRTRLGEGILLGGLVSWGQLALTLLIGGGVVRTLPVELLSFVQSGSDQVGALAALVVSLPPMLAIGLLQAGIRRTGAAL
jgi:putative spermidine/putrescine transport system permease protein